MDNNHVSKWRNPIIKELVNIRSHLMKNANYYNVDKTNIDNYHWRTYTNWSLYKNDVPYFYIQILIVQFVNVCEINNI